MKPRPSMKIEGKRYEFRFGVPDKPYALKRAKEFRREGQRARVVRTSYRVGGKAHYSYDVFVRNK